VTLGLLALTCCNESDDDDVQEATATAANATAAHLSTSKN
jgi:hypothetical protein